MSVSLFRHSVIQLSKYFSVHRLAACLAFMLRLSPDYDIQFIPLLEVLQTKSALKEKVATVVKKTEVKHLLEEISAKLCP
jgi:hypothetical protein